MSFLVREQFPEFEINEFTEEKELTLEEAILAIRNFNWVEEYSKSVKIIEEHAEPAIWLKNHMGDTLAVSCNGTNKFVVYYSPKRRRSSTSVVNGLDQINELVKLFDKGERSFLLNRLKHSEFHFKTFLLLDLISPFTKDKTRTSREIVKEEFVYKITVISIIKHLAFSFIFLLTIAFIPIGLSIADEKPVSLNAFLVVQALAILFFLPGLIIAVNHWKKNGDWILYFRKGENRFIMVTRTGKEILDKSDFVKRITTTNSSHAPWSGFEYTTLIKRDGQQMHFSSMLISESHIDKLFARIEEVRVNSGFQIIKNKKIKE